MGIIVKVAQPVPSINNTIIAHQHRKRIICGPHIVKVLRLQKKIKFRKKTQYDGYQSTEITGT